MWTNEDRIEKGEFPRKTVRFSDRDLRRHTQHLESKKEETLYQKLLIRRELASGDIFWFTLPKRLPEDSDLLQPLDVAAFQLGLCSRLVHVHYSFVSVTACALAYFDAGIPSETTLGLRRVLEVLLKTDGQATPSLPLEDLVRDQLKQNRVFQNSHERQAEIAGKAISLSRLLNSMVTVSQVPIEFFRRGVALGEFLSDSPAYLDVYTSPIKLTKAADRGKQMGDLCSKFSWPGTSKEKLYWLLQHELSANGLRGDFRQESLSTIEHEDAEFAVRQMTAQSRAVDSTTNQEQGRMILEILKGVAVTGEEIAAEIARRTRRPKDVRSLRDNKRGSRHTTGSIDELMRLGRIAPDRAKGGYYRTDAPPDETAKNVKPKR